MQLRAQGWDLSLVLVQKIRESSTIGLLGGEVPAGRGSPVTYIVAFLALLPKLQAGQLKRESFEERG